MPTSMPTALPDSMDTDDLSRAPWPWPWPAMSLADAHAYLTRPGSPFEMAELDIRGVRTRVWKNAPSSLRAIFLAGRAYGDKPFLIHEQDRVSFEAFARATIALATDLVANGIGKGDRVAIAMRNVPEFPVAFFAATLAGAIAVPLNAWWTGSELQYGLVDSGARAAIMDGERASRLTDHLAGCAALERIYVCRSSEDFVDVRAIQLEDLLGAPSVWKDLPDRPLPDVDLQPDDDATIFYTSGTTGLPKGALGTHRNSTSSIMAAGFTATRTYIRRGQTPPGPSPTGLRKCTLISVPFFHTTGCQGTLVSAVFFGGSLVLMRRWEPELALSLIERERVTVAGGVPTIAWQLLEHPARKNFDLSSLEGIYYGGAPASPDLARRLKVAFPHAESGCGWGMTETSSVTTHHLGEDYENRPDSCGPALPVCDLRITDADGVSVPAGEIGELWVRGPNVVKEYWNDPEATAKTFVEGWVRTGDLARLDDEGFCYILDRAKDMLIRGGENIYCVEVENALYEHPAVVDAAVVPIPHRTLGEEPGGVVTLKRDAVAGEAELRAFVGRKLAAYKVPVRILFWPEPLPRNAQGKILKRELRKLFA